MNKKVIKVLIGLIILSTIAFFIIFMSQSKNNNYINKKNVKIRYDEILNLSKSDKDRCIEGLIEYLNNEYFYICDSIEFYNNTFDESSNKTYFYALAIGEDESLIEITNLGNGKFKYSYIGNELIPDSVSEDTGVSYTQIIYPDKYQREKDLEQIREDAKKAPPDDTEMP